jgi:hypothetical protein
MWNPALFEGYVNYLASPALHRPDLDAYYERLVYYDGDGVLAAQPPGELSPALAERWNAIQDANKAIAERTTELYSDPTAPNAPAMPPPVVASQDPNAPQAPLAPDGAGKRRASKAKPAAKKPTPPRKRSKG